jgi:choline dehydrogenase
MQNADYIIIGSGSAGSALAYRLSEDGKHTVMVLEYGRSSRCRQRLPGR